ncbi:hypothetical protein NRB20_06690 [Nocardia sp. RB20]|uniref:Uncharacterized protein n=1 Tax=Nocardia macrotermitis TaxID=2585198 RepID=A0A7K0CVU8_9NOCA|nr:hypothetical protein [Nocardia macrotermitis]
MEGGGQFGEVEGVVQVGAEAFFEAANSVADGVLVAVEYAARFGGGALGVEPGLGGVEVDDAVVVGEFEDRA